MRIVSLDHTSRNFGDGLDPFKLHNLRKIVIVAGPNGAGKTRLLARIAELNGTLGSHDGNRLAEEFFCAHYPAPQSDSVPNPRQINVPIVIGSSSGTVSAISFGMCFNFGKKEPDVTGQFMYGKRQSLHVIKSHRLVPKSFQLKDASAFSLKQLLSHCKEMQSSTGVEKADEFAASYIQDLQNQWWNATHPHMAVDEQQKSDIEASYESLQQMIQAAIGQRLFRDVHGFATLYGMGLAPAKLSHGQTALLMWCASLHAQGAGLSDAILLFDEPENHLHPEAMITSIERFISANTNGQTWISTHSVPLIAHLYQSHPEDVTLVFMEKGRASIAGKQPEQVLRSLMGGEDNLIFLRQFIDLPDRFAVSRFAAECLVEPPVKSDVSENDPQSRLAAKSLLACRGNKSNSPVRLLDFGAGHGRVLDCLHQIYGNALPDHIDYVAYNESRSSLCDSVLDRVYSDGASKTRSFTDRESLFASHPPHSFDAVLMCNVLHEVSPVEWLSFFSESNLIARSLAPSGALILIEDYAMPTGERAHRYGFIVLGGDALRALFNSTSIRAESAAGKYSDRIRAHVIPRCAFSGVTADSRRKALELAASTAKDISNRLAEAIPRSYLTGQQFAFWRLQYANCKLALEDL